MANVSHQVRLQIRKVKGAMEHDSPPFADVSDILSKVDSIQECALMRKLRDMNYPDEYHHHCFDGK
jgi:hypothetical protein